LISQLSAFLLSLAFDFIAGRLTGAGRSTIYRYVRQFVESVSAFNAVASVDATVRQSVSEPS